MEKMPLKIRQKKGRVDMAARCIVCKKELPEGSKLPICEYHKGVAAEKAKQAGVGMAALGVGMAALGVGALVMAKDTIGPIVKDNAVPVAKKALGMILKH